MVQYYTLEQAAQILQTTPEKVKEMAKKNEVRAFQDRGSLRFRAPEIDELARSRGLGSDPALVLGEAPPKSTPPSSTTKRKSKLPLQEQPIAFIDDTDEAPIGKEPASSFGKGGSPSSTKTSRPVRRRKAKGGRKPTMTQPAGMKSPPRAAPAIVMCDLCPKAAASTSRSFRRRRSHPAAGARLPASPAPRGRIGPRNSAKPLIRPTAAFALCRSTTPATAM